MRDTRSELLQEAEVLIRGRGYSGFSYADLATGVGIRKASIHHYFPAKADLAVALLDAYDRRYDRVLASIAREIPNDLDKIVAYGRLYLDGVEKGLGCLCAAFAAELETLPNALRADLTAFFAKHVGWLEAVLSSGRAAGTIRATIDPGAYARMVVASLEGALMMERALGGPVGFAATIGALEDALRATSPEARPVTPARAR